MLGTLFYVTPLDDSRMVECVPGRDGEGTVKDENRHSVPFRPRVGKKKDSTQREGARDRVAVGLVRFGVRGGPDAELCLWWSVGEGPSD